MMAAENNDIFIFKDDEDSGFCKGKTLFLRKKFEEISKQHTNQLYVSRNKYSKTRNSDSFLFLRRHSDKEDFYENVITKPKLLSYIAKGNRPTSINEFIALRNKFELCFNENLKIKQTDESVLLQSNSSRYNHNDDVREKFALDHENKYNLICNSNGDSDEDDVTLRRHFSTVANIYNYGNIKYGGRPFSYRSQNDLAVTKEDINGKIDQDLEEIAKKKIVKNVIQKINAYRSKQDQTKVKTLINTFESIGSENI